MLGQSARAAIAKHHRLRDLNIVIVSQSGGWNQIKESAGMVSSEASLPGLQTAVSDCILHGPPSGCVCVLISPC